MDDRKILEMFLVKNKPVTSIAKFFSVDTLVIKDVLKRFHLTNGVRGILEEKYKSDSSKIQTELDSIVNQTKENIMVDYRAITYFLVYGFSKRGVYKFVPEITDPSGTNFQKKVKKYGLNETYKGILFLHTTSDFEEIIREIIVKQTPDKSKLVLNLERYTSKYRGIKLEREDDEVNLHNAVDGELRNLIQLAYKSIREHIGFCQYRSCKTKKLQTSHANLNGKQRPHLFKASVNEHFKDTDQDKVIDLEIVITKFLKKHQNCDGNTIGVNHYPPVTFLCRKHHIEYDALFTKEGNIKNEKIHDAFIKKLEF
ncbi:hypothetical protein COJ40_08840 [Bacillus cereus]|nr:hypothetical protein COJ40_08840 [Bacillus cereus]